MVSKFLDSLSVAQVILVTAAEPWEMVFKSFRESRLVVGYGGSVINDSMM